MGFMLPSSVSTLCATPVTANAPTRYAEDAQAGGHADGIHFVGETIRKRLQDQGRGQREATALASLARSERWARFVPGYVGVEGESEPATDATTGDRSRGEWLIM